MSVCCALVRIKKINFVLLASALVGIIIHIFSPSLFTSLLLCPEGRQQVSSERW